MVDYSTAEERDLIVDKALREGNYPIASSVGVMVIGDKDLVMAMFREMAAAYARISGEPAQVIYQVIDDSNRTCIAIHPTHPSNVLLYGVTGIEFMATATVEERLQ